MWEGYLGFYVRVTSGDLSAWWAFHNEHRIILSRLLFWMDIAWFKSANKSLIVFNYLIVASFCLFFWKVWREREGERHNNYWLGFFFIAWFFSWIQEENFSWGFQSQFFLAQMLPFAAFYFMHKAASENEKSTRNFSYSLLIGILCVGSMANGILALPLMAFLSLILRMKWYRVFSLVLISVLIITLYFEGYVSASGNGSFTISLFHHTLDFFHFLLLYIGSPFYYIFGHNQFSHNIAVGAGMFMIAAAIIPAFKAIFKPKENTFSLFLLTYILYFFGTAVGTTSGRLLLGGVEQALAGRYATPALIAWASLVLLYLPSINKLNRTVQPFYWVPFLLALLALLPYQINGMEAKNDGLFERKVAALAFELGARDEQQIKNIYHTVDIDNIVQKAQKDHLSIFGVPPIEGAKKLLGTLYRVDANKTPLCRGSVDAQQDITGDNNFLRITGWIFDPKSGIPPARAVVIDEAGIIQGIVITGKKRPDVESVVGSKAELSGFSGYVRTAVHSSSVQIVDLDTGCHFFGNIK